MVDHVTCPGPKFLTRMLMRDLLAVANRLVYTCYMMCLVFLQHE